MSRQQADSPKSHEGNNGVPARLVIGTRGSDLALFQARLIRDEIERRFACPVVVKIIKTTGDRLDDLPFERMEGKGFFTKEIEQALLSREIDLAVHSLKDLMTVQPAGLKLGAVGFRADRREMLLVRPDAVARDSFLPVRDGSTIGTGSNRRRCQIAALNPSLKIRDLRGNVPTRVARLRNGDYDAIVVAAAGVQRLELDLSDLVATLLDPERFLPAPAQGILGLQIREDDPSVERLVSPLDSPQAAKEAALERGLLARFDSGCSLPLGVHSEVDDDRLRLRAILGRRDAERWIGIRSCDVRGTDVDQVVSEAYAALAHE